MTHDPETVEAVAKAIAEDDYTDMPLDWATVSDDLRDDYLGNARAALDAMAAIPAQGVWQPIETAPKDGTWILIYHAAYNKRHRMWVDRYHKDYLSGFGTCNPSHFPATHWQPLPTPPVSKGGE